MPNRILKESICTSDNIDMLTPFQETFFYRLIVNVDDYGRTDARPKILAARLYPLKTVRVEDVTKALQALSAAELVILYTVDGKPLLQLKSWERHQQIRAAKSRYPAPDEACMISNDINCDQMSANDTKCPRNPIQKESNPNPIENGARARFTPPTPEDVRAYCREKGYAVDAGRFCDFYASKGWKVGNQPMKDWQAAVRTWARQDKPAAGREGKTVGHQQYDQRAYSNNLDALDAMMAKYQETE